MDLLKKKGLRNTAFRREVLSVFTTNENAITVNQIEESIGEHDRITLYRTIKSFLDKGLIHEIVMPGDIKKLALCKDDCDNNKDGDDHDHHHDHIHFHCKQCDEIICVEGNFPDIQIPGFNVSSFEIQAQGVCSNCL